MSRGIEVSAPTDLTPSITGTAACSCERMGDSSSVD